MASDPDGDALTYEWSGCASGDGPEALCLIGRPGPVEATVVVSDGRGGRTSVSGSAEGVNVPPAVPAPGEWSCGCYDGERPCSPPLPTDTVGYCIAPLPERRDSEGDALSCESVHGSGACTGGSFFECGGVANAASFDFRLGPEPGECRLLVRFADAWGAVGERELTLQVKGR